MNELERLEETILALEAQREVLGPAVVETALAPLREKLAALRSQSSGQQRRHVTVLFAELIGAAALAQSLDAEDLNQLLNTLWARLDRIIVDHGGRIDKHVGGEVMALWGVVTAREDDAERAIECALALRSAAANFEIPPADAAGAASLQLRIGVHTGPALLGAVGSRGEYTAMGDTVNLASRLEYAAGADTILVSHDTFRQVQGIFSVRKLAPLVVKGKSEPVQAYEVLLAKPRMFRIPSRGVEGIDTPTIGQAEELSQLQDSLLQVCGDGLAQTVLVTGEAGMGKSRLLDDFRAWIEPQPIIYRMFQGRATLQTATLPYALLRDLFAFRFGLQDSDPPALACQKMEAGFESFMGPEGREKAHFVGALIGMDYSDSPYLAAVRADARQLRDRALQYLAAFFMAVMRELPVVAYIENIHWADPHSLAALDFLAHNLKDQPFLLICTARPLLFERFPDWGKNHPNFAAIHLLPLAEAETRQLVAEILRKVPVLPQVLSELIVTQSGGNPYYVEELVKMLMDDGVILPGDDEWTVAPERLVTLHVPPTLTGVIEARLDSLPAAQREVLQRAAIVGRVFWAEAVAVLASPDGSAAGLAAVEEALAGLNGRDLVFRRPSSAFAETTEYVFQHTILHEVTYETVLKRQRRADHARVARWLMQRSGERAEEYAGSIARHLEQAEEYEGAATWYQRAGIRSAAQYANDNAVHYFTRALELTPTDHLPRRYELLVHRTRVYDLLGERSAQAADLAALAVLAEALNDDRRRIEVMLMRSSLAEIGGDYDAALNLAEAGIALAQDCGVTTLEAEGRVLAGLAHLRLHNYAVAQEQLQRALALTRRDTLLPLRAQTLRLMANILLDQGQVQSAMEYQQQALEIARQVGDRRAEGQAYNGLGGAASSQENFTAAIGYYAEYLRLSQEIGDRSGAGAAFNNMGDIHLKTGRAELARTHFLQALDMNRQAGNWRGEVIALANLGETAVSQGLLDEAASWHRLFLERCCQRGDWNGQCWGHYNLAQVALRQQDLVTARRELEAASECLAHSYDADIRQRVHQALAELQPEPPDDLPADLMADVQSEPSADLPSDPPPARPQDLPSD
jgi:predicted ATPase/class 3 adenylate cyclase